MVKLDATKRYDLMVLSVKNGGYSAIVRDFPSESEEALFIAKTLKKMGKDATVTPSTDNTVLIFHHVGVRRKTLQNLLKSSNAKNAHEGTRWL